MIRAARKSRYIEVSAAVERIGRAIAVHREAGRFGVAQEVLDRAIAERQRPAAPEPLEPGTPLAMTGLPPRTVNLSERYDIRTVADLADTTDRQLRLIPHMGDLTVRQIRQVVRARASARGTRAPPWCRVVLCPVLGLPENIPAGQCYLVGELTFP